MAQEHSHPQDDLDKTDRLPILDAAMFDSDSDFADDAVRLDHTAVLPQGSFAAPVPQTDFVRPSGVDLPSLAESVRSVEERIARQGAEFEALSRSYERVRDSESASIARANALTAELASARAALELEQARSREFDKALTERIAAGEAARARVEEVLRESEGYQAESRTLRESMAARDATIVQVLHSLGERDAQLASLQQEHAKLVPVLEATSKSGSQLQAELQAARAQAVTVAAALKVSQEALASAHAQLKSAENDAAAARSEIGSAKVQATTHLELLQTREWRSGFDLNQLREMDAKLGAARSGREAMQGERDRLASQVAVLETRLTAQVAANEKLQAQAAANATMLAQQSNDLKLAEENRVTVAAQLAMADGEVARLNTELAARGRALMDARAASSGDAQRVSEILAAAEQRRVDQDAHMARMKSEHEAQIAAVSTEFNARRAEVGVKLAAQIAELQAEAEGRDQEMSELMAHLQEARRPIEIIEAEVTRLKQDLAAKTAGFDALAEEHQKVRSALERTRGALEEREFLIRRLERSESNNANVLGRIQTSIERLGSASSTGTASTAAGVMGGGNAAVPVADWSAELIRVDGERPTTHVLARRTRIGRAQGCELQIDSTSVSRHHALVLVGPRDCIIEDLNSTNGVLVNGRKVARQLLSDGDSVTIGDIQFRYSARTALHASELHPSPPPSGGF